MPGEILAYPENLKMVLPDFWGDPFDSGVQGVLNTPCTPESVNSHSNHTMPRRKKTKPRFNVILADREPQVRSALRFLFAGRKGLGTVSEVTDTNQVIACIAGKCADLLLIDWDLPGQAIDTLLPIIKMICPRVFIVVLSAQEEDCQKALLAGADAYLGEYDPPNLLLAIIDELMDAKLFPVQEERIPC